MFILAASLTLAHAERFILLEGESKQGRLVAIEESGGVVFLPEGSNENTTLPVEEFRSIAPDETPPPAEESPHEILLLNGTRLSVSDFRLADESITGKSRPLGDLKLSLDGVRAARLQALEEGSRFDLAWRRLTPHDNDIVYLTGTGIAEQQEVEGLVESIDGEQVLIDEKGKSRRLPLASVHGIVFASTTSRVEPKASRFQALLEDGSLLATDKVALAEGKLTAQLSRDLSKTCAWSAVRRLGVRSERLEYLSEMEPAKVERQAIYSFARDWKRDRNVRGAPLRLGEITFDKGLGTAGGTALTFANSGVYETFTALVGVDANRGGLGECAFVVMGDGKELARERMRGSDAPKAMRVDVRAAKEITLRVDIGDDLLDLSDDGNWCEASFLKPRKS